MAVYDVDKLMQEARKLAADFRKMTGKPLGISSEIAVHDVIRLMGLEAAEPGQGGYDAVGKGDMAGKRIQIKGRTHNPGVKSSPRLGQIKLEQEWDSVMLVILDEQYEAQEIYEAERDIIVETVQKTSAKRRNRGAMSIERFKKIGKLVWPKESGKAAEAGESADTGETKSGTQQA